MVNQLLEHWFDSWQSGLWFRKDVCRNKMLSPADIECFGEMADSDDDKYTVSLHFIFTLIFFIFFQIISWTVKLPRIESRYLFFVLLSFPSTKRTCCYVPSPVPNTIPFYWCILMCPRIFFFWRQCFVFPRVVS